MKNRKPSLSDLLKYFPEVEPPITFSEDYISTFSRKNDPLPLAVIEEFIKRWEDEEIDEFTEFIPCLKLSGTEDYHALVYWKGGLLRYEFKLVTLDKKGGLISIKTIASTLSDNQLVRKSVARIDEDLIVHIVAGENIADDQYDPSHSQDFAMEIIPTGDIIFIDEQ